MLNSLLEKVGWPLLVVAIAAVAGTAVVAVRLRDRIAAIWLRRPWPRIDRVPRTEAETRRLLAVQPPGWEHLHFAGELRRRLAEHADRYRDHSTGFARPSGLVLADDGFGERLQGELDDILLAIANWTTLIAAHGRVTASGDADEIAHLADRLTEAYVQAMDWSDRLRGARVPDRYRGLVSILARFAEQPIRQYRGWVAESVRQMDRVPALLRDEKGPPVVIELELVLSIDPATEAEWEAELARVS